MRKPTWGPVVKERVRHFVEAILSRAEQLYGFDDFQFRWEDNARHKLVVETKRRFLERLTNLNRNQIYEVIESLKTLEILDDNRTQTQGKDDWHFTLKLWGKDKIKNLSQFDREWENKRPEKSKAQGAALEEAKVLEQCRRSQLNIVVSPREPTASDSKVKVEEMISLQSLSTIYSMSTTIERSTLSVLEPELPIGQVPLTSNFYVERPPIEERCYHEILHPGALIRIKSPSLMGKTSLMARILNEARKCGYQTVPLSFQLADRAVFTNLDTFLRWFCENIGRKLKQIEQLNSYWTTYGSKDKATVYFEECLLEEIDRPLVIGLDEVDRLFPYHDIADDFFSLLRAWYEYSKYGDRTSELWKKLRFVLVHSKEVYIPLNINQSPFNVGLSFELQEFNQEQVKSLVERHQNLNWTTAQVEKLMDMVGGHPYLVRLALYHTQQQDITFEQLLKTAPTEAGIYSDHLRRHLVNLKQHPDLLAAFKQVVTSLAPVELDTETAFKLHSMGLVVYQYENKVAPRCNLYLHYFHHRLQC